MGILAFLILLVVSVLLVTTGWRGRRVGEAPHCKACGFDLSGLTDEQPRCPECGADITEPAATVLGARRRRPRRLGFGLAGLALCATPGWFGAQGKLNTASVIASLPSGWLIGYAVCEGERPFAEEMRRELFKRLWLGALTNEEQLQRTSELLVAALEADSAVLRRVDSVLLERLASSDATPDDARRKIAVFLLDRAPVADGRWGSEWGGALAELHDDALVSDAEWNALIQNAATPRLWRLGDGSLAPGEGFVLGMEFLGDRLPAYLGEYAGGYVIVFDLPAGSVRVLGVGEDARWLERDGHIGWSATGMPGHGDAFRGFVRAPQIPGRYEIGVRVVFTETNDGRPDMSHRLRNGEYPGAVTFTDTLTIEVSQAERTASPGTQPLADWLRGRVLPIRDSRIELALPRGRFLATGDLVAVTADGDREFQGSFRVVIDRGTFSSRWTGVTGSGSSGGSSGGSEYAPAGIGVRLDPSRLPAGGDYQLLLVFDTLELPDGRTHKGPEPLEVPVPAHPLGWSTSW